MTRYRAPVTERVEAAKYIAAKVSGVNQIQQRHDLPSSDDFIRANPDKFEKLRSPGDCFLTDLIGVPYA